VASASDQRVIVGAEIRKKRRRSGLTQEKLAEKADLHPNYLGRVERGEEYVSLLALRKIAKALNVRVRNLVWNI
jgi:transcriptional regulator with XRE-family HTH domain